MKLFLILTAFMLYMTVVVNQHNYQYAQAAAAAVAPIVEPTYEPIVVDKAAIELPIIKDLYSKWIDDVSKIEPSLPNWPDDMDADIEQQVLCLALNLYHEARGSTVADMVAVGQVTMNRVEDSRWKSSICDVVWQYKQFSWTFLKTDTLPHESDSWIQAQTIALLVSYDLLDDNTSGANHYHATYVDPVWSNQGENKILIGGHIYMTIN